MRTTAPPPPSGGTRRLTNAELDSLPYRWHDVALKTALRVGVYPLPASPLALVPEAAVRRISILPRLYVLHAQLAPWEPSLPEEFLHCPHLFPGALYFIHQVPGNRRPRLLESGIHPAMRTHSLDIAAHLSQFWAERFPATFLGHDARATRPRTQHRTCRKCHRRLCLGDFGTPRTYVCDSCTPIELRWRRTR